MEMWPWLVFGLIQTFHRHAVGMVMTPALTPADRLQRLESLTSELSRQLMLQQLYVEEKTRSEGDSGIKQVRVNRDGPKPYYVPTHTAGSVAAIHDHANYERTVGMGEVVAVLNGVEFRTRHNDYKLVMAANSSQYHATVDIPLPPVPPAVLQRSTIAGQIAEMREWFRAWRNGYHANRDYRPYFRPVLCYLEGAWTTDQNFDEPFESDRHLLDASSWLELQEKIRFTSYAGDKSNKENLAFLPRTVVNVSQDGVPVFAQWNYRILCHPVSGNVRVRDLKPVDNLGARLANQHNYDKYLNTRLARFTLNPLGQDKSFKWRPLDDLMSQIPGKDNYGATITDDVFGLTKISVRDDKPLNVAYYHRWYKLDESGAMGESISHRGFSDRNLFVAETTQDRVAPVSLQSCQKDKKGTVCKTVTKRFSYAIPLELIFLTPLQSWNPFGLRYKGSARSELGQTVTSGGRNGKQTPKDAFNGTNSNNYYLTPFEFFSNREVGTDVADTVKHAGVLDPSGRVRHVSASGVRILLPEINDLGVLRTRFPIMPVHAEGSPIWKELEALRDVVMDMKRYEAFLQAPRAPSKNPTLELNKPSAATVLRVPSTRPGDLHEHLVSVTPPQANLVDDVNRSKQ